MEEKQNNLYIPANIKTRLEIFNGFGMKELVTTIIVVTFSIPIIFMIYMLKGILISVICFFMITAGTVIANTKDGNNLCMIDQIKFIIRKSRMQKLYEYRYKNKWEVDSYKKSN